MSRFRASHDSVLGPSLIASFLMLSMSFLTCTPNLAVAADDDQELSGEQLKLLKWFDDLRFPQVEALRLFYAKDYEHEWYKFQKPDSQIIRGQAGFLIPELKREGKDAQAIFMTDRLQEEKWSTSDVEEVDLDKVAILFIQKMREMDLTKDMRGVAEELHPLDSSKMLFWAWACWRHRQNHLAKQILDESSRLYSNAPQRIDGLPDDRELAKYVEYVEYIVVRKIIDRLYEQFRDANNSRRKLIHECQWFLEHFPNVSESETIIDLRESLERMLVEDEIHALDKRNFEQLNRHEQISELIYQLREQQGSYRGWSGFDVIDFSDKNSMSPAHRLVKYGFDAIPQLIEALDNSSTTRLYGHDSMHPGRVDRICNVARNILREIAGIYLDEEYKEVPRYASSFEMPVINRYRRWYAELLRRGEQQLLVELVEQSGDVSEQLAKVLVDKYPAVAAKALQTGILRANLRCVRGLSDTNTTNLFISELGRVSSDEALSMLVDFATNEPCLSSRIKAAEAISRRGSDEGLKAMLIEWYGERSPHKYDGYDGLGLFHSPSEPLACFLLRSGRIEAIKAIEMMIISRKDKKEAFLQAVSKFERNDQTDPRTESWVSDVPTWLKNFPDRDPIESWKSALERLLFSLLDDTDKFRCYYDEEWRNCDQAAFILMQLKTGKATSTDRRHFLETRDRKISELKQSWLDSPARVTAEQRADSYRTTLSAEELLAYRDANERPSSRLQELSEGTEQGDENSVEHAKQLVEEFSKDAAKSLRVGIIRAADPTVSTILIKLFNQVSPEEIIPVLLREARSSGVLGIRVSAAKSLMDRLPEEALQILSSEWLDDHPSWRDPSVEDSWIGSPASVVCAAETLLACQRMDAMKTFARGLQKHAPNVRMNALSAFLDPRAPGNESRSSEEMNEVSMRVKFLFHDKRARNDWKMAIEEMIVSLLEDVDIVEGNIAHIDDIRDHPDAIRLIEWVVEGAEGRLIRIQLDTPRVCDFATIVLHELLPEKYQCDVTTIAPNHDQIRVKFKNIWLKQQETNTQLDHAEK